MYLKRTTLFALLLSHSFLMSQWEKPTNIVMEPRYEDGFYPFSCNVFYEAMAFREWKYEGELQHIGAFINETENQYYLDRNKLMMDAKNRINPLTIEFDRKNPNSKVLDADIGWNKIKLIYQNNKLTVAEEIRWDISRKDAYALYNALIMKNKHCGNWWKKVNSPNVSLDDYYKLNKIVESFYYKDEITKTPTGNGYGSAYRSISVFENKGLYEYIKVSSLLISS